MSAVRNERTRARREALQVMYQSEITGAPLAELLEGTGDETMLLIPERPAGVDDNDLIGVPLVDYAAELLNGTLEHLDEIDDWIDETAENWAIDRMPVVDKNIIRIAAFEIAFRDDIPTGVAINEAVESAKAFGGDESPKFVNGVLGKIAQRVGGGGADRAEADDGAPDGAAIPATQEKA